MLETEQLSVQFGGHLAVDQVSCRFNAGTLTAIVGPNGAGKTTYFNLISGQLKADEGTISFQGRSIRGLKPHRIVNLGVARTFQLCRPFVGMSVIENVLVGSLGPRVRDVDLAARALHLLSEVGLAEKADTPSELLSYGDLRRLEIARALATDPELLLLDEPFAGLGSAEIESISALIRKLHAEKNLTILLIEHKLREFMQLVSRVVALDFGEVIAEGIPAEIVSHPRVIEAYIGKQTPEALA